MRTFNPMQLVVSHQVMEQQKKFYFVPTLKLMFPLSDKPHVEAHDIQKFWETAVPEIQLHNDTMDLGMPKEHAEFLATASFHAPDGKPVTEGIAKIKLADIEKKLLITGDRSWEHRSKPQPFTSMPISYENAYGATEYDANPRGKGYKQKEMHNIELFGKEVIDNTSKAQPASFAPLDMQNPARTQFSGQYDKGWLESGASGYPADMDRRMFNAAPIDQWHKKDWFTGTEKYVLTNLNPNYPVIEGILPHIRARCFVKQKIGLLQEMKMCLDTVWFLPSAESVMLIWRGFAQVKDDEASQIEHLVAAYENIDENKPLYHYKRALRERLDPKTSEQYDYNETDFIPENATCWHAKAYENTKEQAKDSPLKKRLDALKKNRIEENQKSISDLKENYKKHGIDYDAEVKKQQEKQAASADKAMLAGAFATASTQAKQLAELDDLTDDGTVHPHNLHKVTAHLDKMNSEDLMDDIKSASSQTDNPGDKDAAATKEKLDPDPSDESIAEKSDVGDTEDDIQQDEEQPTHPLMRPSIAEVESAIQQTSEYSQQYKQAAPLLDMNAQLQKTLGAMYFQHCTSAHLHKPGLSPHSVPLKKLQDQVLAAHNAKQSLAATDYACIDLSNHNLQFIDFTDAWLEQVNFSGCDLTGADFTGAVLARANFTGANLNGANFSKANLGKASFLNADLAFAKLDGAIVNDTDFTGASLIHADLMKLEGTEQAKFSKTIFSHSKLDNWDFKETDLTSCQFDNLVCDNVSFQECNLQGVNFSNIVAHNLSFTDVDLQEANFSKARVDVFMISGTTTSAEKINFSKASIKTFNASGQSLMYSNFNLFECKDYLNLEKTNLSYTKFLQSYLPRASITKSLVYKADFSGGHLAESMWNKSIILKSLFVQTNLYRASFKDCAMKKVNTDDANLDMAMFSGKLPTAK